MSQDASRIFVAGSRRSVRIRVEDWPDPDAHWRVSTQGGRGRDLEVVGYHRFSHNTPVASARLHVPRRGALLLAEHTLAETLINAEKLTALAIMVLCAAQISIVLKESVDVGTGYLEWQVDHKRAATLQRVFPDFRPVRKRGPGSRRGVVYLSNRA